MFKFKPNHLDFVLCILALDSLNTEESKKIAKELSETWRSNYWNSGVEVSIDAQLLRTALVCWMDQTGSSQRAEDLCRALDDHLVTVTVQAQIKPKRTRQEISEGIRVFAEQEQARLAELSWTKKRDAIFREIFGV
jgi:hypothetical protein